MNARWGRCCLIATAVVLAAAGSSVARVKLVTLPVRERVEIQLDNPQATLVEEERIVPLLQGTNVIDFSWTVTAVDKWTTQFRVLNMPLRAKAAGDPASMVRPDGQVETVRVVNVAYPPGENALTWEVYSEKPLAARVRISYLVGNLRRSFNYRAVAEADESTLVLRKYLRLDNYSGEDFGLSGIYAGFGNYFRREMGLSEAKELLVWKFEKVPIRKTYTFDWWTCPAVPGEPDQRYVEMRYVLTNDAKHNMGLFPLQFGKVRIFVKDAHGGEAFLGEDWGRFTPVDDEMKLYLGLARDVQIKRKVVQNDRHPVQHDLYHQEITLEYAIRNFKKDAVTLDLVEDMNKLRDAFCGGKDHDAQWEIVRDGTTLADSQMERKDSRTALLHVPLKAAPAGDAKVEEVVVRVHVWLRNEW
jgi:hypothetical protein